MLQERDAATRSESTESRSGSRLKILFAVASWGLGHATRDLPLIQRMLDRGHQVTVVSSDRALDLLKQEIGARCTFLEWPDLPVAVSKTAPINYAKFTLNLPLTLRAIVSEYRAVQSLLNWRRFDRIVSDSRFGVRSRSVASYHVVHGLRFIAPRRNPVLEQAMEYVFYRSFGRSSRFVVPDFAENGLSGELSHGMDFIRPERVSYIGIISGIRPLHVEEDLDCYVSISGPEPQRTILESIILDQIGELRGRVVVSLGKPEEAGRSWTRGRATIYAYVNRYQQQVPMNRARLVVSRSGYTTMMELAELGKPALLIPTPGQTEQEYLAALHAHLGNYHTVSQDKLDLSRDVAIAAGFPGYCPTHRTDRNPQQG